MTLTKNPRLIALGIMALGAAILGFIFAIGGMEAGGRAGGKAILLVGVGGIALGTGLMQLIWPPPPPADARDERNFFKRSSWPQKVFYVFGGFAGIVLAAILQTMALGKI